VDFKKGQTHRFGIEELRPWSQSNYAWRWSDPKHDLLPPDVLSTIQTVLPEAVARLYPRLLELELWAQEEPDRVIQTAQLDEEEVARTLEELSLDPEEPQLISWNSTDAVLAPWRTFVRHWSSFCYPSSDDVAVVPQSGTGVLSYHHAEYFCWRARREDEADHLPEARSNRT
jgi:hypothetical protein